MRYSRLPPAMGQVSVRHNRGAEALRHVLHSIWRSPSGPRERPPRRRVAVLAITAALLWTVAVPQGAAQVTHPFAGITLIDRVEDSPRSLHMRIVQIDLR